MPVFDSLPLLFFSLLCFVFVSLALAQVVARRQALKHMALYPPQRRPRGFAVDSAESDARTKLTAHLEASKDLLKSSKRGRYTGRGARVAGFVATYAKQKVELRSVLWCDDHAQAVKAADDDLETTYGEAVRIDNVTDPLAPLQARARAQSKR